MCLRCLRVDVDVNMTLVFDLCGLVKGCQSEIEPPATLGGFDLIPFLVRIMFVLWPPRRFGHCPLCYKSSIKCVRDAESYLY